MTETETDAAKVERLARIVCSWRGVDPDAPVTIVANDGSQERHDLAWKGYTGIVVDLLEALGIRVKKETY